MGFVLVCTGEFEQGYELLNDSTLHNPYCPWWFYGSYLFYFLQKKEYQTAFNYALKVDIPGSVWDPLLKAATLGQLNRIDEAGEMLNKFLQLMPNAGNKVKNIFEAFLLSPELNNELLTGLRKAGLNIPSKKEITKKKIISEASNN